jgi:threonylcarbamoyladenosine tRNA methylthiotransferase MtaB
MKTVKFYTLGCKVNQYETQQIREQFQRAGFIELENSKPADTYIINTCTVTHQADRESLFFIRRARRQNPHAKIVVCGCLAELGSQKIPAISGVNLVVRNQDKQRILCLINGLNEHNRPERPNRTNGILYFKAHTRAFLKIQDGCNNYCSFCRVRLVRGKSRSKDLSDIIKEARALVRGGFKEIVLCGICLGSYGKDLQLQSTLADVISGLEKIEGLERIRLSSIEAVDVSEDLIKKLTSSKKLCPHLHIPIQSGDDYILRKMNRNYTCRQYLDLIERLKQEVPNMSITTDIIVGFPGEEDEHFQNTLKLIKEIAPLKVHIFPYSPRAGTVAADFKQRVDPVIIKHRISRLKHIAQECSFEFRRQFLGRRMSVLIEGRLQKYQYVWQGYTDNYIRVRVFSSANLKNRLIPLELEKIDNNFIWAQTYS